MKFSKNLIAGAVAAVSLTAIAPVATAELSGSVGVASTYLWRGLDLGSGTPAVSGDLSYSAGGAYGGVWVSSGDTAAGTEYDLYVGYGASFGDFSVDASLWSYNYPTGAGYTADGETDFTDLSDFVLSLGFGPVALTLYEPIGDGTSSGDYRYVTLGGSFGQFSLTAGVHMDLDADCGDGETECSPAHLNLDYAFNDNLTFTASQFFADEFDGDDLKVVVSYSIPL